MCKINLLHSGNVYKSEVACAHKLLKIDAQVDRTKIYCSGESLFNYHFSIQSRAGFQLIRKFDEIILRLIEGGICNRWMILQIYEKGLLNTNSSMTTTIKINEKRTFDKVQGEMDHLISLNTEHLGGAFFILFVGYCFALLMFVAEVVITKLLKRHLNKFTLILAHIIDPNGY